MGVRGVQNFGPAQVEQHILIGPAHHGAGLVAVKAAAQHGLAVQVFVHLPLQQEGAFFRRRWGAQKFQRILRVDAQQPTGEQVGQLGTGQGIALAAPDQAHIFAGRVLHVGQQAGIPLQPLAAHFQRPKRAVMDAHQQVFQQRRGLRREQHPGGGGAPGLLQGAQKVGHIDRLIGAVVQKQLHAGQLAVAAPHRAVAHDQDVQSVLHGKLSNA